jgi:hypothetical protein
VQGVAGLDMLTVAELAIENAATGHRQDSKYYQ